MRRTVAATTPWRGRCVGRQFQHSDRSTFGRLPRARGRHGDCLSPGQHTSREEVLVMRALILYMLGVPLFLIVILWLFGAL